MRIADYIVTGQGCVVKKNGNNIATSIREISSGRFWFTVQPHPNFPGIENVKFTVDKVSDDSRKLAPKHYQLLSSGSLNTKCWVQF